MLQHLPNLLSAFRIALAPFTAYAILHRRFLLALFLLAAAGLSDALDGYLARKFSASSRFGAYLDPVSDKLLMASVYLSEALAGLMPAWLVALVFGRDILILGMVGWGLIFTRIRGFPPSIWGKVSTAVQIGAALAVLADSQGRLDRGLVFAAVAVVTIWSGIHYCWSGIQKLRERSEFLRSSRKANSPRRQVR